jgi:hypothetical protein
VEAGGVKGRVEKGNRMVGKVFGGGSESGWLRCGAANEEGECRGIYNYKTHKADRCKAELGYPESGHPRHVESGFMRMNF